MMRYVCGHGEKNSKQRIMVGAEPLVSEFKPSIEVDGSRSVDDRAALNGILYVLNNCARRCSAGCESTVKSTGVAQALNKLHADKACDYKRCRSDFCSRSSRASHAAIICSRFVDDLR
ncbi:hypothetical protein HDG34_000208 [Paraburkholderia sp. HC6.4b]|uniref:hypothetical protein n=1 Tax=unclassified Paraburkholderia TaxID=2615204 RepID=UPI0016207E43|nr:MULTISPECIES: hypothetical protein [unclassified Paraburkholderia]MBB5406293.1 hypothetical protein [Paraburkholderia sp. HC6.4b]MBB5448690.1 hypothetical protein [Paraburkholderia sp. Kb1A]